MKKSLQFTCLLLYASTSVFASTEKEKLKTETMLSASYQEVIKGTVKDQDGNMLPSVSVKVKGTPMTTQTGSSGQYSIQAKSGDVLQFSSIGFTSREITV